MAVLGIITCEILELEFARLLSEDTEVRRISVLEDDCSARLIELLEEHQTPHVQRLPHPHAFVAEPDMPLEVLVRVLALGLHRTRRVLSKALGEAVQALQSRVDALLLGYGLCGGALDDIRAVVDANVPLFQPMDGDHPVDDCVALCLGGRERYYGEQRKIAGTFFLTPGWSRHWRRMLDVSTGKVAQPGLERLLSGYERALLVQTPAMAEEQQQQNGMEFARRTGLRLETQAGTMDPLSAAWDAAKASALGKSGIAAAGGHDG
jgi:hypothetical protein